MTRIDAAYLTAIVLLCWALVLACALPSLTGRGW